MAQVWVALSEREVIRADLISDISATDYGVQIQWSDGHSGGTALLVADPEPGSYLHLALVEAIERGHRRDEAVVISADGGRGDHWWSVETINGLLQAQLGGYRVREPGYTAPS